MTGASHVVVSRLVPAAKKPTTVRTWEEDDVQSEVINSLRHSFVDTFSVVEIVEGIYNLEARKGHRFDHWDRAFNTAKPYPFGVLVSLAKDIRYENPRYGTIATAKAHTTYLLSVQKSRLYSQQIKHRHSNRIRGDLFQLTSVHRVERVGQGTPYNNLPTYSIWQGYQDCVQNYNSPHARGPYFSYHTIEEVCLGAISLLLTHITQFDGTDGQYMDTETVQDVAEQLGIKIEWMGDSDQAFIDREEKLYETEDEDLDYREDVF